jgi:hypothetical protein
MYCSPTIYNLLGQRLRDIKTLNIILWEIRLTPAKKKKKTRLTQQGKVNNPWEATNRNTECYKRVSSLGWDIQGSLPRRGGVGVET